MARKKKADKNVDKNKEEDSKKSVPDKEKVCEVFEVGKEGEEKEVKSCGDVPVEHATKEQLESQNKILKYVLVTIVAVILVVLCVLYFLNSVKTFEYRGVEGKIIQEGKLIFYETKFPYKQDGKLIPYYVYIRNDPRKLHKQIPFNGEMDFGFLFNVDSRYRLVLNVTGNFNCDGYGIISFANMGNLEALGIKTIQDSNATCDTLGRYMFLNVVSGNKTEINQIGDSCYELTVNNCEILKGTERFMTEAFVYYFENLKQ